MDNKTYKHTPYYELPLYQDATPQDLRDGYNKAMRLIDRKLHQIDIWQFDHSTPDNE